MAASTSFVHDLIYGTLITPNHSTWVAAGPGTGADWLNHHLDNMLPALETWLAGADQPPLTPWDGVFPTPWNMTNTVPLGSDLDGSFTGIGTLEQLGQALRNRYTTVAFQASELNGLQKAPFSYRFWGYLKWAWEMRERFEGRQVFPTGTVHDRDGTILSAVPFSDVFNQLHRSWHVLATGSGVPTPGLRSTAGQLSRRGVPGMGANEEFLRFHREHMGIFFSWLARNEQDPLLPLDMGRSGGVPPVPTTPNPFGWSLDEASVAASNLPTETGPDTVGGIEFGYHGTGHGQNSDIGPLSHNNYVARFHQWHGWIDAQWWWREPRFADSNVTTGERDHIFRPVRQDDSDFPGLQALSIVREPSATSDEIYPANTIGSWDPVTGDGVLRFKAYVRDPFDRPLRMRLTVEVFDGAGAIVPASTQVVFRDIGPTGDHPFNTIFHENINLTGAFASDDPTQANPAVGFVNSRVKVTGHLWEPDLGTPDDPTLSPDSGFVHEDVAILDLVREKSAPDVLIYQNLDSFSEDQVNASLVEAGGVQTIFSNAFYLAVQDRFTPAFPAPTWPAATADEVKGLILGEQAASGLFDTGLGQPTVAIWQDTVNAPFTGIRATLLGLDKEDPSLPPEYPQRYTWRYGIEFDAGNNAFTGIALGGSRQARLRVTVRDRAGNAQTVQTTIKLFKDANPFMMDGDPFWLSTDTRTFSVFAGETKLGVNMVSGQPFNYLSQVLNRLNGNLENFDAMPKEGAGAALEYAEQVPNPSTGTAARIYNFAIAKVRLQGAGGATNVRAFFRLFRYTAPNLLFDPTKGYRSHADGSGKIVPLMGFESETAGAALMSIPFFAEPRTNPLSQSMQAQADTNNVHTFPAGPTNERDWYFGVYLDINDPNARLPQAFPAASPNGPFALGTLQSLRTIMRDFHQCMVVEIRYDGDPTDVMDSPSSSDNLAQRNLVILHSDNPGTVYSRTVEHSFEIDLSRPRLGKLQFAETVLQLDHLPTAPRHGEEHGHDKAVDETCGGCGHTELDADGRCACCGGLGENGPLEADSPRDFKSTFAMEKLLHEEAMSLAMQHPDGMKIMMEQGEHAVVERFGREATKKLQVGHPFVFHPTRWSQTAAALDELMIRWNNLPKDSVVRLFLPGASVEEIASLRSLRHAPRTVHPEGGSVLRLDVTETTWLPISPVRGRRQAALITIELPEGVKAGQVFTVDLSQMRAGTTVENGAFRIEIPVGKAKVLFPAVERGLLLAHERFSLTAKNDRWRPILEHRLRTERLRTQSLADHLGLTDWQDPTQWTGPDGKPQPIEGMKIRVRLEKIKILETCEPWWKGRGEVDFESAVWTPDNGGVLQKHRVPHAGEWKARPGDVLEINEVIFEGFASDRLSIQIKGLERDTLDPDDHLGAYFRNFSCGPESWLGEYLPGDEVIDPEHLDFFEVWYSIEKV